MGRGPVLAAWCFGALGSYLVACCPVQQLGWHQAPEWGHSFLYYAGRECHYYSPSDTAAPPSRPTLPLDSGLRAGPFCRKRKGSEEKENHCGSRSSRTTLPGAQRDRAGRAGHGWQARLSHILQQLPAIQALEEPGEPAAKPMLGSAAMLLLQSAAVVLVGQWSNRGWQSITTSLFAEMPGEPARLLLRGHQGPATPSSWSDDPQQQIRRPRAAVPPCVATAVPLRQRLCSAPWTRCPAACTACSHGEHWGSSSAWGPGFLKSCQGDRRRPLAHGQSLGTAAATLQALLYF